MKFWWTTIRQLRTNLENADAIIAQYQEALNNRNSLLERYHEKVVADKDSINNALAEQNRDLVRQLELYKAVLAQLQIPVKLPGKKA